MEREEGKEKRQGEGQVREVKEEGKGGEEGRE